MQSVLHERYHIVSRLGKGGTSQVYLCVDNHINKKWAIKKIKKNGLDLSLASREIENLKSLDYYLFPRITDAFSDENYIYIVTDYIEGKTLEEVLKEKKGLPESLALSYMKELIKGLLFLHSESPPVLYLDMKPSNIIVRPDGSIRLIDFGIATNILEDFHNMGTPGYAAPEQYINGEKLSEKADIFAFGMTTYALITGEKPYKDYETQITCIKKSQIKKNIKELIMACTEYNPNNRFGTQDVNSYINKLIGYSRRLKVITAGLIILSAVFCISTWVVASFNDVHQKEIYSKEMVSKAEEYLVDGEYSAEGLKIICGYLDGNFLDENTAEYFTYEVARNYFEVQGDYTAARRYFSRLNEEKYPEIKYFKRLCVIMTGFGNKDDYNDCINDFIAYNKTVKDAKKQQKNQELIDFIKISGGYE